MPLINLDDLPAQLPRPARLLGLDHGQKRMGCAISDPGWMLASPLPAIAVNTLKDDLAALNMLCNKQAATGLICGLPLALDGGESDATRRVRKFAAALAQSAPDLLITLMDERFSTAAVERAMLDADLTRAKRAQTIDSAAAAYMLQAALDYLNHPRIPR